MNKLESLEVFVAVARAGGFSAASRVLGWPLATVSRKVSELEDSLGVRLFERSTRQVVLTDVAQPYFDACVRLLDDLRDADETVTGEHRAPKGELAVTAPIGFGRMHLQPVVLAFLRDFPEIDLRLLLVDRMVNLVDDHVDVAVRISELPDSSLVARLVGHVRMVVVASRAYLASAGEPDHPSQLTRFRCIHWSGLGARNAWDFRVDGQDATFPIDARLTTTLPESAVEAAQAGLGLARVTSYQAAAGVGDGTLVAILRAFEPAPTPVHLVHPSNRRVPLKLRAFLDYAGTRLSDRLQAVERVL